MCVLLNAIPKDPNSSKRPVVDLVEEVVELSDDDRLKVTAYAYLRNETMSEFKLYGLHRKRIRQTEGADDENLERIVESLFGNEIKVKGKEITRKFDGKCHEYTLRQYDRMLSHYGSFIDDDMTSNELFPFSVINIGKVERRGMFSDEKGVVFKLPFEASVPYPHTSDGEVDNGIRASFVVGGNKMVERHIKYLDLVQDGVSGELFNSATRLIGRISPYLLKPKRHRIITVSGGNVEIRSNGYSFGMISEAIKVPIMTKTASSYCALNDDIERFELPLEVMSK